MKIKPTFDTSDAFFNSQLKSEPNLVKLETIKYKEEDEIIPNGIFHVFQSQKRIYVFLIILMLIILLSSLSIIAVFAFDVLKQLGLWNVEIRWGYYILPSIVAIISFVKLTFSILEKSALKKSEIVYRINLQRGERHTPGFIVTMYKNLILKQISHNWFTIFILFYGSLFTLVFWALKDQVWSIGNWEMIDWSELIRASFPDPQWMTYVFIAILVFIVLFHVAFLIYRKKRIMDIEAFFGHEIISSESIEKAKSQRNKTFFRLFIISILAFLVIPVLIYLIVKRLRRK